MDPLFYKLSEAEKLLRVSRDTLYRFRDAGLLIIQGENHGRCVTGASLRALAARIEQGEDIWAAVKQSEENRERSERKPTAKDRSIRMRQGDGGTSPRRKTESESPASAPLQSKPPSWLKKIT